MLRRTYALVSIAFTVSLFAPADAVATAQRTFVASNGNDANPCSLVSPCRAFAAAIAQTISGGEVIVLDSAGYGPVTISQSVSIIAPTGVYAGISASSGSAVTIATAGVNVTLRGLNLIGIGAATGVSMTNGSTLSIENSIISNFTGNGVFISALAQVRIIDTVVRNNGANGIRLQGGATGDIASSKIVGNGVFGIVAEGAVASTTSTVIVTDSVVSENGFGISAHSVDSPTGHTRVSVIRTTVSNNTTTGVVPVGFSGASAILTLSSSLVARNACGVYSNGIGAVLETTGHNTVRQNTADNCGADGGAAITTVPEF